MITVTTATLADVLPLRQAFEAFVVEKIATYPQAAYPKIDATQLDNFVRGLGLLLRDQPETFAIFVAYDTERVGLVGFLGVETMTRTVGYPNRYGYGQFFWVDAAYRDQGIGRRLVAKALRWWAVQHVDMVELRAVAGDTQWSDLGWEPIQTVYVAPLARIAAHLQRAPAQPLPPSAAIPLPRPRRPKRVHLERVNGTPQPIAEAPRRRGKRPQADA
jgi:GNAT superfamily N-acetyltransferase